MCMRVEFHHRKKGLSAFLARSMKSNALALTSSSMVSIRFLVSGPVSVMPPPAKLWITPRGQHFVAVTKVILAELAGHVALVLEQPGDGRVFLLHAFGRARQPHLGEAGANWRLPGDERSTARGAALLTVPVGEHRSFFRDAIDVRRLVAHDAMVVGADVEPADVISPEDEDIGFLCSHELLLSILAAGMIYLARGASNSRVNCSAQP